MSREVPTGWTSTTLGEQIVEMRGGGTPSRKVSEYWNGNIPWASVKDLKGRHIDNTEESISEDGLQNSASSLIPKGTLVLATRMAVGKVVRFSRDVAINQDLRALFPRPSLDVDFLHQWFSWQESHIARLGSGTTVAGIRQETIRGLQLALPPLHEQRRIAEILSSVDAAIAATRAVIEQTRKVRSEILSTSFPEDQAAGPSTADDTFEGWSVEPASSICESIIDCKNRTPPVTEDGYAVVRTPNVRNGRFRYEGLQFTDRQSFQEWTAKGMPRTGDILFTREAPYGEVCMAPAMAFCLGQRMMFLRPDTSRVSSDFLLYALQSGPVKKEMFRRAGGSTVGHLRVGDVRELPIPVAPRDVQLRLTSTLRSLDEALYSNEESLSRLENCKSALMSDLLTGGKRVIDALLMAAE
ncbi:hypothetical protein ASE23_20260 [Rhizobium sp. Root73]|uniref:restriction endonuclease subunit S n=1 Tax=unclassified Rhizobium TaxID=2613769 RepID=UPI000726379E|nr:MULTISPECIES: restriction endonuclease subunit S [unclassified Rhizobium]KQY16318.1 hypothetical protein ASD36_22935 [Rhizobium sp. Root1334]KRC12697.1 hypothetical protein ASE23_20260 [Rhizobium sp. Root73]